MKRFIVIASLLMAASTNAFSQASSTDTQAAPQLHAITLPAGTRVLMTLTSPLHTTSAASGSGVYLETCWPVVQSDTVVIPAHTRVLGQVEQERRPGRVKGRAQFRLRFTSLILPDNRQVPILAGLQSVPGNEKLRTQDAEGTIEPVDQIDRDVYTVTKGTVAGGLAGALTRSGTGAGAGLAIGGGLGLAKVLFTRGDEIRLPAGTEVEMTLQRSVTIDVK